MTSELADLQALRRAVRGTVTLPGDDAWDAARRGFNLAVDQRPVAVVEAADAGDVQAVVGLAAGAGLRVAPQATGHGSEAMAPLDGAILLKTSALREVSMDPGACVARVGAGVQADEVAAAAGEHGLSALLGFAPTVGVAGLAMGGGFGWLGRPYGLAAESVRAFEVVTAGGERLHVDAEHEPDLFWALRGGGGRFAIVTALELALKSVPDVSGGMIAWPAEHAADVLEQFRSWTPALAECTTGVFRYLSLPPLEAIPAPLRGRRIVAVIAVHIGTDADAQRAMAPWRAARGALVDTFGPIAPVDLVRVAGDPEQPGPARGAGFLLDDLTAGVSDAVAELVAADALAPIGAFELRQLGGALRRAPEGHGALGRLDAGFSVFAGGPAFDAEMAEAMGTRLAQVRDKLAPWTARQVLSTASPFGTDLAAAFDADTNERLERVRDAYDPGRLIQGSHDPA